MARYSSRIRLTPLASAAWLLASHCAAQTAEPPPQQLEPVTITSHAQPPATVAGWGDVPLDKAPVQANVFTAERLKDSGATRLADLVSFDPAVSDAYNTEGYWDYLTIRGFVIDNRFNYRRDGLPINAETRIELDNKSRTEILTRTSGTQAGTSAPGGLVNYVVKRPLVAPLRSGTLEWRQGGELTGTVDLSQRFGNAQAFGVRLNAAAARLDSPVHQTRGDRHLLALAADWRLNADTVLEAEFETSHRLQPSVPAFSLLGNTLPAAGDPRINLNNQPWSLPVVFDDNTASLRWRQRLNADWAFTAHAASQALRTDDRIAFPYGCTDTAGTYYADRYCPSGQFDLYDFRSENERRRTDVIDASVQGHWRTGAVNQSITAGVQRSTVRNRFQRQAYNYVGNGDVSGTLITPADPTLTDENTQRDEHSTELYLRDALALNEQLTLWLGLRHTQLARQSVRTDGSRATDYRQSFSTPWLALSHAFAPGQLVYASWGQGVESEVTPNRARYINAGEALPALKSRQAEIGLKGSAEHFEWGVAAFDITRPQFADIGSCDVDGSCLHALDGTAHHRGVELTGAYAQGAWALHAGTQWLQARRHGSQTALINGLQPTNVPALAFKLDVSYAVPEVRGLVLQGQLRHESTRMALPDNSARIPSVTTVNAGLRWDATLGDARLTWRAGVDNLLNQRAWRESPYQFGHAYLFPLAPRTVRASVQVDL